jgi:hypothetical protein
MDIGSQLTENQMNIDKNELDHIETELNKQLKWALSVQANTKEIQKQLEIIKLAKIGYSQMLDY